VQRVLGLSLDQLDAAYQQDLARRRLSTKERLLAAKVAAGVDGGRWQRLAADCCTAMERLRAAFRQSSLALVVNMETTAADGRKESNQGRYEFYWDGQRWVEGRYFSHEAQLFGGTPGINFDLRKKPGEKSWQLQGCRARNGPRGVAMPWSFEEPMFLWYSLAMPPWWPDGEGLTVTGIGAAGPDGRRVRVSFASTRTDGGRWARRQGWFEIDPRCDFGFVAAKWDFCDDKGKPTSAGGATIQYQIVDGRHVPKVISWGGKDVDGHSFRQVTTIESCRLVPPPDKVFQLASYGDFPPPQAAQKPSFHLPRLTWIAGGCTLLALLLAAGTCPWFRRHSP
jgi:hypothetical protein